MISLAGVLLTLAALGTAAGLLAIWALDRRLRSAVALPQPVAVTVLRPLHGAEPELAARLQALVEQAYDAPVQFVFGLHTADDSAGPVVAALVAAHPGLDIVTVVDPREHGNNHKVSNLINMAAAARHGVLVLTDSDILVAPDWLGRVTAALGVPGVGAVTAFYTGAPSVTGIWARLAAMAVSYQFLPGVALGVELGLAHPCMGSTIALRADTLSRIGGFASIADALADDYELGRAVRALGLTIAVPPLTVVHAHREASFAQLWRQELRWARTTRAVDAGVGYAGQLVTFYVPLALAGTLLAGLSPVSLVVLAAALGVRGGQKYRIDRLTATDTGPVWWLPLRDTISLAVWAASYFVRSVDWRGTRHRLAADGTLLGKR